MNERQGRRTIVVGIGNPLRGDDALGPIVAAQLTNQIDDPSVIIVTRQQLLPDLASNLALVDLALIVDASVSLPPGEIAVQRVADAPAPSGASAHQFDLADLLALTVSLYGHAPTTYLVTAGAETLELRDGQLSKRVASAVPRIIAQIDTLLRRDHSAIDP